MLTSESCGNKASRDPVEVETGREGFAHLVCSLHSKLVASLGKQEDTELSRAWRRHGEVLCGLCLGCGHMW